MPDARPLVKAKLLQMDEKLERPKSPGKEVTVQFNPETLKLSFANEVAKPGAGDKSGSGAAQVNGMGTTKLTMQLWFDVTAPLPEGKTNVDDVRELTQEVVFFISPQETDPKVPPAVRFLWGTFQFDGVVDSLEESLEFFSNDGKPLRASISLSLSQQKILKHTSQAASGAPGAARPGTRPLTAAQAGASVQGLAESLGNGADWQAIAAANGIENPRLLRSGQLIDLRANVALR